jgi:hypothetical protein
MTFPSCRVPAPTLLALLLTGCGGVANDMAEPLVDTVTCALRNCTESSALGVDEISPRFTATQTDGGSSVVIEGFLGKSANLTTTVMPAANERLSASIDGGGEVTMSNPDGKRLDYTASLTSASARPVVRVIFTRAGVRHVSEVTLPAAFTVLQPVGCPTLTRSGASLPVRLSLATTGDAGATASGSCARSDGSSFAIRRVGLSAVTEPSVAGGYRLDPVAVDAALTNASRQANNGDVNTPAVSRCQLTVAWGRTAWGSIAATLNAHGSLGGQRQATHALVYDARL